MKLNLCSGQRPFDKPWVNVDVQPRWNPDLCCDVSKLPYEDGAADMIVIHQGLEHFGLTEGVDLLKECHRALASGGSLIVFVPDQAALAKKWLAGEINDYIYTVNMMGAYMGDEADRHRWGYCYRSLREAMVEAGFRKVGMFDWRAIPGADLARDWWVLAAEGMK